MQSALRYWPDSSFSSPGESMWHSLCLSLPLEKDTTRNTQWCGVWVECGFSRLYSGCSPMASSASPAVRGLALRSLLPSLPQFPCLPPSYNYLSIYFFHHNILPTYASSPHSFPSIDWYYYTGSTQSMCTTSDYSWEEAACKSVFLKKKEKKLTV